MDASVSPLRRSFLARAFATMLWSSVAPLANAVEPKLAKADWQAIRKVISQQLAALRAGDGQRAFGYASPGIRAQFGDAQTFIAMVRAGYAPLLAARYTEFLEGAVIDGVPIQPLRLIARDNTVLVALYTLEKRAKGGWRISGCSLAPSKVQAA
jgi:DNA-binding transcriptional LysR family regulator